MGKIKQIEYDCVVSQCDVDRATLQTVILMYLSGYEDEFNNKKLTRRMKKIVTKYQNILVNNREVAI
jgi:hypothetical protein